jgi:WGR domain-containing protein
MIHLRRVDPTRNMARFYAMAVQPTLFGEWAMEVLPEQALANCSVLPPRRGRSIFGRRLFLRERRSAARWPSP